MCNFFSRYSANGSQPGFLAGAALMLIFLWLPAAQAQEVEDLSAINAVLDEFHSAAATGDWSRYFALMSDDGVFLGTDAGERWPKSEFQRYAQASDGWVYRPTERNVDVTSDGMSAWFDELLDSQSYGTSRGTGILVKSAEGWRIAQYHLTFPIPNALVRDITDQIKAFEAGNQN